MSEASHLLWPSQWLMTDTLTAIAIATVLAMARVYTARPGRHRLTFLATAPLVAAALALPLPHAIAASIAGMAAADAWHRRRLSTSTGHLAVTAAAVALASLSLYGLGLSAHPTEISAVGLLYAAAGGAVIFAVQAAIYAAGSSVTEGAGPDPRSAGVVASYLLTLSGAVVLGYLGAILAAQAWWGPLLPVVPVLGAHAVVAMRLRDTEAASVQVQELSTQIGELEATRRRFVASGSADSVRTFASGLAHEINNPLFAILGRADLLLSDAEHHLADETAAKAMHAIQDDTRQAAEVVRGIQGSADVLRPPD